ncbi:potassium channel subfamily K member 16-like isoform X2 [Haliotis cracherodii]|uniref:potassium channel subfamily K member 16-like isoform X2 n=1 Tax=Haliotis cracherodii TaxID=6455 RepID=UPI0039E9A04F
MLWKSIAILSGVLLCYILLSATVFHYLEQPNEISVKEKTRDFHMEFLRYGNIAPTTLAGQVFCILCALCGIPLCTVFLAAIGQKLRYPITKLQERLVTNRSHRVCRCVKFCLCVLLGSTLLILLPSIMFTLVEGWHYGESVYYTVITLTTIGFGDYVAGLKAVPHREIYRAVAAVWVTLGLAWVALLISEMTGDINDKIVKKEKKCCTEHVSKQDELQMASLES